MAADQERQLAEVGGRAWKCGGAPLGKPRLHLGIGKGRVDLRVELVAGASTLGVLCWKSSRENIVSTANFLFDHLVGEGDERRRHVEPERLCRLEVDDKLELDRGPGREARSSSFP